MTESTYYPSFSISLDEEVSDSFEVHVPGSVRELRKEFSNDRLGEYLTVNYKVTLTRRQRRLYLQTLLDFIWTRKERPLLVISLGEYILLEDLFWRIETEEAEEERNPVVKTATEQLLSVAYLTLKYSILLTRYRLIVPENQEKIYEYLLNSIEDKLDLFQFSDDRTFNSRVKIYAPEKVLSFTVGVPLHNDSKRRTSIPYDSYTKGYQESHKKKRREPIDWEIDGYDIYDFTVTDSYDHRGFTKAIEEQLFEHLKLSEKEEK